MKRSEINTAIKKAKARLNEYCISLPQFGYWSVEEWKENSKKITRIVDRMLGWDVTDFGTDNFADTGAVLFTVRNGDKNDAQMKEPYCEKYIILDDSTEQQIPMHYHIFKTEDIINRAGGTLVVQMYHRTVDDKLDYDKKIKVFMDGIEYEFAAGENIEIKPGNSITIEPFMFHRFIAKKGDGMLIVGEVSKVNDDNSDNIFLNKSERFIAVCEDEKPICPLVNEYKEIIL